MNKIIINSQDNALSEMDEKIFGESFEEKKVSKRLHHASVKNVFKQDLIWRLERTPLSSDIDVIDELLKKQGYKFIKSSSAVLHYRLFKQDGTSTHVKIAKEYYGAFITCHEDLEIHGKFSYLPNTLELLSALYLELSKKKGKPFLIPRQKASYQGYLSSLHSQKFLERKKRK